MKFEQAWLSFLERKDGLSTPYSLYLNYVLGVKLFWHFLKFIPSLFYADIMEHISVKTGIVWFHYYELYLIERVYITMYSFFNTALTLKYFLKEINEQTFVEHLVC